MGSFEKDPKAENITKSISSIIVNCFPVFFGGFEILKTCNWVITTLESVKEPINSQGIFNRHKTFFPNFIVCRLCYLLPLSILASLRKYNTSFHVIKKLPSLFLLSFCCPLVMVLKLKFVSSILKPLKIKLLTF